jgi:hypothetical protein
MHAVSNLAFCLASPPIVQPNALVSTYTGEDGTVGGKGGAIDEAVVLPSQTCVELEGGAVVENDACVVRAGSRAQRPLLADRDAVDLRGMARDLADAVAAVCGDAVAEALLAIADCDDALRVAVPGDVVDPACDDVVVTCTAVSFTFVSFAP